MITISNEHLSANVNFKGAELSSLTEQASGTEYIWQADPQHWARHAPFLFPIVGKLKKDEYLYDEKRYNLSQHGFARDLEFEVETHEQDNCTLVLKSSLNTRISYPFKFQLKVTYRLKGKELLVALDVKNLDHHSMYFSIGGHPAFRCPINNDSSRSDYSLLFEKKENANIQLLKDGIRSGETVNFLNNSDTIRISNDLFANDALIFANLDSEMVTLCEKEEKVLSFVFKGFPYLGIWSKSSDSEFVCIEPWFGIADHEEHNFKIEEKEGILSLEPKDSFKAEYSIIIH